MLTSNDEIWFWYDDTEYQVSYAVPNMVTMNATKYEGTQKISEHSEDYRSIIDMLENFRIDGKPIRDIWSEVSF